MPTRILTAFVVTTMTLLAYSMVMPTLVPPLHRTIGTPLGAVPVMDLIGIFFATACGAAVARCDFRRWALAAAALVWLLQFGTLVVLGPRLSDLSAREAVHSAWLGLPLGLVVAWFGAQLGRWAAVRIEAHQARQAARRPVRGKWR